MSDSFVRWIPVDPSFVPSEDARGRAVAWLRERAPNADEVWGALTPDIRFVDCGGNPERISCPRCGVAIDHWWPGAMGRAAETRFDKREVVVPCCGADTCLEDLRYEWPVGFARFVLEARNARIDLSPSDDESIARLLDAPVRRILAHL